MPDLTFYTTDGCHLCKTAERLIGQLIPPDKLTKVDIATDDNLIEHYGERIPVVTCHDRELEWPFSLLDLQAFIAPE